MKNIVFILVCSAFLACSTVSNSPESNEAAFQQSASDGELQLTVTVDRVSISAAEVVELTLQAAYPEGATLTLPAAGDQLGEFLVESESTTPARMLTTELLIVELRIVLAPLSTGELEIPPLQARAALANGRMLLAEAPAVPVVVTSLIDQDEAAAPQLRDIENPLDPPFPTSWKLAGVAAALFLIGLIIWWRRRPRVPEQAAPPEPPVAPSLAALARLDAISHSGLLEHGQHKELYFELSATLREYIERQFAIQAKEQTTAEFFEALRGANTFTPPQQSLLRDFLYRSDLIKFAELSASPDQCLQAVESCRAFIVETASAHAGFSS
jgi:hypothetical protein